MGDRLPDPDALLVALVLAPGSYPRNRFFRLYRDARVLAVRRRAAEVRGIVRRLSGASKAVVTIDGGEIDERGGVAIRYRIDAIDLRGMMKLSRLERAIVEVALSRAAGVEAPDASRAIVEEVLRRLVAEEGALPRA